MMLMTTSMWKVCCNPPSKPASHSTLVMVESSFSLSLKGDVSVQDSDGDGNIQKWFLYLRPTRVWFAIWQWIGVSGITGGKHLAFFIWSSRGKQQKNWWKNKIFFLQCIQLSRSKDCRLHIYLEHFIENFFTSIILFNPDVPLLVPLVPVALFKSATAAASLIHSSPFKLKYNKNNSLAGMMWKTQGDSCLPTMLLP